IFQTGDSSLASATLDIFAAMGTGKATAQIKRAFHHKDSQIRSKALDILAKEGAENAKALCLNALKDSEKEIRIKALKLLTDTKDRKLAKPLFEMTKGTDFDSKDLDEKREMYIALAKMGGVALMNIFKDQLKGGVLDRSDKAIEKRVAAAWALSSLNHP